MIETKFEEGKTYPMDGTSAVGTVIEIRAGELKVRHSDDGDIYSHRLDGRFRNQLTTGFNLLLPAIEPEGAPAKEPLSSPTVSALESYMDFWAAFRDAINLGLIDPTDGGYWPEWDQDATIHRAYPTQEAALADCQGIIAAIDRLLEGGAR